tara:strand:+ start:832 stop:1452 length:621 start_codon:yes stop_codon:yes gene_type:complete
MAKYQLAPGETKRVLTSSRYLSIIELDGRMEVASPSKNLKPFQVKPGWNVDLADYSEIEITNTDSVPITAELQDAGVKISSGGGGAVSVTNKPVIQRIEEPMPFNANVTFDKGSVTIISPSMLNTLPDKVCPTSTSTLLADGSEDRTTLMIQNRSAEHELRIGGNTVSANAGFVVEPGGTVSISSRAPVFAYNPAGVSVTVTLTEM